MSQPLQGFQHHLLRNAIHHEEQKRIHPMGENEGRDLFLRVRQCEIPHNPVCHPQMPAL